MADFLFCRAYLQYFGSLLLGDHPTKDLSCDIDAWDKGLCFSFFALGTGVPQFPQSVLHPVALSRNFRKT